LSRVIKRPNDFLQLAEPFLVTGRNDLPENFGDLLDEFHRLVNQDRIPHNGSSKAKRAPCRKHFEFASGAPHRKHNLTRPPVKLTRRWALPFIGGERPIPNSVEDPNFGNSNGIGAKFLLIKTEITWFNLHQSQTMACFEPYFPELEA
jgi:hypothetical protein